MIKDTVTVSHCRNRQQDHIRAKVVLICNVGQTIGSSHQFLQWLASRPASHHRNRENPWRVYAAAKAGYHGN